MKLQLCMGSRNISESMLLHLSSTRCKEEIEANLAAGKPYVIRFNMPTEGTTTFHDDIYGDGHWEIGHKLLR